MNVMVMAAGFGTRMRPHTEKLPKPLIPFLGNPLINYSLKLIDCHNVSKLVINSHHLPNVLINGLKDTKANDYDYAISHEKEKILDSAGGIKKAQSLFLPNTDVVVLNADNYIVSLGDDYISELLEVHQKNNALATFLAIEHPKAGKGLSSLWLDRSHRVQFVSKKAREGLRPYHMPGVYIVSSRLIDRIPEGESSGLFKHILTDRVLQSETVMGLVKPCLWHEVGDEANYLKATESALGILSDMFHPSHEYLKEAVSFGNANWSIYSDKSAVTFNKSGGPKVFSERGFATIGNNVNVIKENVSFKNVVCFDNVTVDKDIYENQVIS